MQTYTINTATSHGGIVVESLLRGVSMPLRLVGTKQISFEWSALKDSSYKFATNSPALASSISMELSNYSIFVIREMPS